MSRLYKLSILFNLALLFSIACGDEVNEESASITLTPDEIFFEAPPEGESSKFVEIDVANTGNAPLIVNTVLINENDDSPEVTISNSESWSDSVNIPPQSSVILRLEWSPSNNVIDRGQVIFDTNIGEKSISFTTAPLTITPVDELCGDGELQDNEECDDGNRENEDCLYGEVECEVCADDCTLQAGNTSYCGDEELQATEACDDGNQDNADGCSESCELEELCRNSIAGKLQKY